jgi:ApbE superfamily uncharacterized protein (UPF0280 family)
VSGPQAAWLPDGRRLHLHHGPIDLILDAVGAEDERRAAFAQARARFDGLLEELVAELPRLRRPDGPPPAGPAARRMARAVAPHEGFVTPMAAVAGAVADEVLAAMIAGRRLERAYVNDGGDVALHLAPGAEITAALRAEGDAGRARIRAADPVRGLATSGWRGRSWSLGVADAVTALAGDAAAADVAATLIANAVDLPDNPGIIRGPACAEEPDSDLGARAVTLSVPPLPPAEADRALAAGAARAEAMRADGLIAAAALFCQGRTRIVGPLPGMLDERETFDA